MLKELFGAILGIKGNSAIKNASINETQTAVNQGNVQFIDVRSIAEYKSGHAKQAINFPLDTLQNSLSKLDKNKPIYVICQSGMRSLRGASILSDEGFTEVYNVEGGTSAWLSENLPIEKK